MVVPRRGRLLLYNQWGAVINTSCIIRINDRNQTVESNQRAFDMGRYKRYEYILLLGFGVFTMLGYFITIISLANFCQLYWF